MTAPCAILLDQPPAIGTPVSLGTNGINGSSSSIPLTTSVNIPAGALIVLAVQNVGSTLRTVSSISDGSNTYQVAENGTTGSNYTNTICYAQNAVAISSGTVITVNFSGAASVGSAISGAYITGISLNAALDQVNTANSTGTTASTSTGTLRKNNEIVIGSGIQNNSSSETQSSGFSSIVFNSIEQANFGSLSLDYQIVSTITSVTYNPVWPGTGQTISVVASFRGF